MLDIPEELKLFISISYVCIQLIAAICPLLLPVVYFLHTNNFYEIEFPKKYDQMLSLLIFLNYPGYQNNLP